MTKAFQGDIQILLYTEEETFSRCRDFYRVLLRQEPYYTWDENPQDCGAKFHAGRGTISVLCQLHDIQTGPVIINLEIDDVDRVYEAVRDMAEITVVHEPVTQSYGTRYFTVEDPCGNRINIYRSNH